MKSVKGHPSREQLLAFTWGQLSAADQTAVSNHIANCDLCCERLREIPDDEFVQQFRHANLDVETSSPHVPKELTDHPRYKLGKFLGSGGMGLVYQAEHRLMDRQVALKIIHRRLIRNPRVVDRFRQEVKAAARLSHPNIVTAYDAEQAGDVHFLVMEYVDGISLARLVKKQGPLEMAHACNLIRQAAKGLQHAHQIGMVHRDIKPQNLMLSRKGQVKILDFGLARLASETDSGTAAVMGTPDFMAPEQGYDSHHVDIRADLYSLGCTLYFLLSGEPPFPGGSAKQKLFAQKHYQPKPIFELRSDLPPELTAILHKMMAKDPAERYQTPAEVVKALAPFSKTSVASAAAPAAPATAPEQPAKAAPPVVEVKAPIEAGLFLARCPFCKTGIRIPLKGKGASIPCPQCSCYFTAVPEEDGGK